MLEVAQLWYGPAPEHLEEKDSEREVQHVWGELRLMGTTNPTNQAGCSNAYPSETTQQKYPSRSLLCVLAGRTSVQSLNLCWYPWKTEAPWKEDVVHHHDLTSNRCVWHKNSKMTITLNEHWNITCLWTPNPNQPKHWIKNWKYTTLKLTRVG